MVTTEPHKLPEKGRGFAPEAKVLHWVTAFFVLGLFALTLVMNSPRTFSTTTRLFVYTLHKSFGMTVFVMTLIRIEWRARHPAPPLPSKTSAVERYAVRFLHVALYAFLLIVPFTGWVLTSIAMFRTDLFGFIPLPRLPYIDALHLRFFLADHASEIHEAVGTIFLALILAHIAWALWHHFKLRDFILLRMAPRKIMPFLEGLRSRNY